MKETFWQKLPCPIFALAPMADVTDAAFRRVIAHCGKPDVMFTEFTSVDGLMSAGRENIIHDLWYSEAERPIVAQVFGAQPELFLRAAQFVRELGFDGIDINMGCPEKNAVKQGSCAALINDPSLAREIILAMQEGAGGLPVSVKTRIGFDSVITEEWVGRLLETGVAALTLHGRTKKEMSKVPAHWDEIGKAVRLRDAMRSKTLIIGNGDVGDLYDAMDKVRDYGVDGVMLGRAIFGNPWLFRDKERVRSLNRGEMASAHTSSNATPFCKKLLQQLGITKPEKFWLQTKAYAVQPEVPERLRVMLEHTKLFSELFSGKKNFASMKKHFKAYVHGFDGAKDLRIGMMATETSQEVEAMVLKYLGRS